ncbi:hypothetical protein SAMN05421772_10985 [Paracoccus saliphilus]|uniref:Uncharacterized protein n=1 Tax=Paracoccus saliphilus TaxID=405559 RepID=A0AA45W5F7_9RHOB|nr:hypothetical protein SAMN05421772_10985 [Paracoccus saliphilus]
MGRRATTACGVRCNEQLRNASLASICWDFGCDMRTRDVHSLYTRRTQPLRIGPGPAAPCPSPMATGTPGAGTQKGRPMGRPCHVSVDPLVRDHSMIFDTTPAPTVRPPSRMAKRSFSSIAIGAISSTSNFRLSPGITISVPSGRLTVPVTSVVRK